MGSISRRDLVTGAATLAAFATVPGMLSASSTGFRQSVAEAAARDRDILKFYTATGFAPVWTGRDATARKRRQELLRALENAGDHGLPEGRYDLAPLEADIRRVKSERDLGRLEVAISALYLDYARDVQTGVLVPSRVDDQIARKVPYRSREALLQTFALSSPGAYMRALPPEDRNYTELMKAKIELEKTIGRGGWGEAVNAKKLELGDAGPAVVALRNRLIRMGYMRRTSRATYDEQLQHAVARFQKDHGLFTDGVAGSGTLGEINRGPEERLTQVIVAMERERWINLPGGRGERHVWVNLMDFHTRLYDNGKTTFMTRSVVGQNIPDKRTPEFSDMMEYMEINPDWTVPRSILGRDYLPKFQKNPNAAQYLDLFDDQGRRVPRDAIDFSQYTEETFPFTVRQPPGRANALGTVKFMFPNRHAIYLHDTPERHLFQREVRDFSSGCIRLHDPHDFAYVLLRRQMSNPEPFFQSVLASRKQTIVPLEQSIPVHLDYRTAFTLPKERLQHRRDVYGRDRRIWNALQNSGVALRAVRG